jgi:hypothetical protein
MAVVVVEEENSSPRFLPVPSSPSTPPSEEEKLKIKNQYQNNLRESISDIFDSVPSQCQSQTDFIYNGIPVTPFKYN